jgi:hypothetical protein
MIGWYGLITEVYKKDFMVKQSLAIFNTEEPKKCAITLQLKAVDFVEYSNELFRKNTEIFRIIYV